MKTSYIGNRTFVVKRAKCTFCSALREPENDVPFLKTVFTVIIIIIIIIIKSFYRTSPSTMGGFQTRPVTKLKLF